MYVNSWIFLYEIVTVNNIFDECLCQNTNEYATFNYQHFCSMKLHTVTK
jgi:hypothetical protein